MSTTNTSFAIFKDNIGNWNPLYSDLYVKFSNSYNEDRTWLKMYILIKKNWKDRYLELGFALVLVTSRLCVLQMSGVIFEMPA